MTSFLMTNGKRVDDIGISVRDCIMVLKTTSS